jgi:hypothetical protein
MSATATAAPATEEKKPAKSLAPNPAILELQEKIYAQLKATVDGTSASIAAAGDTYYANLPGTVTREQADDLNTYNANHVAASLGAVGKKGIEVLAENKKVTTVAGLIAAHDGKEVAIMVDRDYTKTIAGKEISIKGRVTMTVDDVSIGKTGQTGRVYSSLKNLAAEILK